MPQEEKNSEIESARTKRPVAKGKIKNKSGLSSFTDIFVAQDFKTVSSFVIERVIVPSLQRLAVETINSLARGIFMGEGSIASYNSSGRSPANYVSYNSMYESGQPKAIVSNKKTSGDHQFAELTFDNYGEAQLVLDAMDECLADSGVVTIADMYSFAEVSCPYTGNYYGWTNISNAKIVADSDGYWIKLPKARPIKN